MKIGKNGHGFVTPAITDRSKAVNVIAHDLITDLGVIVSKRADFDPTTTTSTRIVDLESGVALYNVRAIEQRGGNFHVGIYPLTSDARAYLRDVSI